jgi:flagellar basal body-associated protein FliL
MATKNETQTKPEDVDAEGAEQAAAAPHSASATASPGKPAVFLDVADVLVNLSASGGERTLKVKVTLELPDQAIQAQIQPVMAASATAWRCASPSRCANPA